jgi:hypothetical protein
MAEAQRLAARRAIDGLGLEPDHVVVDGNWDFVGGGRTQRLVRADAVCLTVAAASILAKVTRDRIMRAEAPHFPDYDFDLNKGYPCPRHKLALAAYGPTSIHRRRWVFMDHLPWTALHRPVHVDATPATGYPGAMTDDQVSDEDVADDEASSGDGADDEELGEEGADDDGADDTADDDGGGVEAPGDEAPSQERLQQLQDDIDHARKTAEDADVLIDPDEPRFYQSGEKPDEDDQAIAPPG